MALERFGGVGGIIRKAVPFAITYLFGRKMGERGTRKQADAEVLEQRAEGERAARKVQGELGRTATGDYIRNKDI